jgi:hypothetical protein
VSKLKSKYILMNKVKLQKVVLSLVLIISFAKAYTQKISLDQDPIDTNIVKAFAFAIRNPNVMIGVFEIPKLGAPLSKLKSGIIPETQAGYFDLITKYDFIKLNLITSIRGNFDSIVFLKRSDINLSPDQNDPPQQIFTYSGTKWLIIVKSIYHSKDESNVKLISEIMRLRTHTVFNEATLFQFSESSYGALCLEWPNDFEKSLDVKMTSDKLINDLNILVSEKNNIQGSNINGQHKRRFVTSMSSSYGKAIGEMLIGN